MILSAVLAPLVVCVTALPIREHIPNADVALVLLAVVATAGAVVGRLAGVASAAVAAFAFDVLWTRPFGRLTIRSTQDVITACVILVVGVSVGEILRPTTEQRAQKNMLRLQRRRLYKGELVEATHLRAVSRVAEEIVSGDDPGIIVIDIARSIVEVLGLADCAFEVPPFDETPRPELLRTGELDLYGCQWDPSVLGLPRSGFRLPVECRGLPQGRFVCTPRNRSPVPRANLLTAITLADQAASALLVDSQF
ncbi:MAG TPA: DUF4118 domain-containing protein [Acidimicrobiales bacterium]|nr:DUF4118 domain-containing protein [Acidimicrobiales bacterium]